MVKLRIRNLQNDKSYLLAISGGLDSMVLLNLFNNSGYKFIVAHMNFKLRGKSSDLDEEFVRNFCKKNNCDFHSKNVDVLEYKKSHHVSTQMAARELRYSWFNQLKQKYSIDSIVTAHHLDDVLEGFLVNIGRGSNLDGLMNMWNVDEPKRPLLDYTKAQIKAYAISNNIDWREDTSNQSNIYDRNYIRNNVIPALKESKVNYIDGFKNSLNFMLDSYKLNIQTVEEYKSTLDLTSYPIEIPISSIKSYIENSVFTQILFSNFGFYKPLEIQKLFNAHVGSFLNSKEFTLLKDREAMLIYPIQNKIIKPIILFDINDLRQNLPTYKFKVDNFEDSLANYTIDFSKIKFPVSLRFRENGDRFFPFGMNGSKNVSKYFKDLKFSKFKKETTRLLVNSDNSIIWVVDYRLDRRFTVSQQTKEYLNIYKL